jgi:hypothetical protein
MTEYERPIETWRGLHTSILIFVSLTGALPPCFAQEALDPAAFVVVESQFHARDQEDAGEVRICLRNTGTASLSMAQLRIRIVARRSDSPDKIGTDQKYLYAKLSPPVLQPGQYGQLVAKLLDRPANAYTLTCTVSATEGTTSCTTIAAEPALWISYVGFSQDLRRVCVYVENGGDQVVCIESLQVGEVKVEGPVGTLNRLVPPKDKGCLTCRLSTAMMLGEFVPVAVSAKNESNQDVHIHSIVRAINRIPLMMVESAPPTPDLGLDSEGFTETMVCIAHAHGTHEQAASGFLEDYVRRFRQNPHEVIQVDICRSDSPRAWFRFGSLPDVARMNPVLSPPPGYDKEDHKQWFNPFLYRGHLAKKAVEPCRYLAVMPIDAEEGLFLQKGLTPQEVKFLVYCAVASGAKGLGYRGTFADGPLHRSAFVRLNRELRQIESLLLIGEPVEWATATDGNYAAKSLLCGDQAILVMLFDHRYFSQQRSNKFYTPSFGRAVTQVRVDVRIPGEVSVGQVRSLSAPLDRRAWVYREGNLSFAADMVDSVQVYLVDLRRETRLSEVGGLVP